MDVYNIRVMKYLRVAEFCGETTEDIITLFTLILLVVT